VGDSFKALKGRSQAASDNFRFGSELSETENHLLAEITGY